MVCLACQLATTFPARGPSSVGPTQERRAGMSVPTRGMRVLLLVATVSSSLALGHGSAFAATAAPRLMFAGHSYGTWVAGAGANAGKTANVVMWCRTKPGIHHSNSLASANVPGALAVGE